MTNYKITFLNGEDINTFHLEALNRLQAKRRFEALQLGRLIKVSKAVKMPDRVNHSE